MSSAFSINVDRSMLCFVPYIRFKVSLAIVIENLENY